MPTYTYSAIDSSGARVSGEIDAGDPDAAASQLTVQGLRIERLQPAAPAAGSSREAALLVRPTGAELRELGGHIAEIVSSGLPMEGGLAAIAEELPRGRLRRSLQGIVRELETGDDLETVLARRRAPAWLPALVRAGQRSGRTAEILEAFISHSRVASEMRQSVWTALVYPLAMLLVVVPLVLFLFLWIVPSFAGVFADFEIKLPLMTELLLSISRLIANGAGPAVAVLLGVALVVLAGICLWMSNTPQVREVIWQIPIIGPLVRWMSLARFSQLLSLMVESRVPLDEALVLAGDAAGDAALRTGCRTVAAHVRAGMTLESAAQVSGCLPPSFVRALCWERHEEAFAEALESTADIYASRARVIATLVMALLPPIVLILVAALVGFVVVALFMPLVELLNKLS